MCSGFKLIISLICSAVPHSSEFGSANIKSMFMLLKPTSLAKSYVSKNSSYVCILPICFNVLLSVDWSPMLNLFTPAFL